MAELLQAAAALLLPPPAGVALTLLLLELSLAQPARPALAASIAKAAIAATVICLIPALLVHACKIKRIIIPNERARAPPPRRATARRRADHDSVPLPGTPRRRQLPRHPAPRLRLIPPPNAPRSEEHTSELQSHV